MFDADHTVADNAGSGDNYRQYLVITHPLEVHMLQGILWPGRGYSDPNSMRDKRQNVRGALEKILHVSRSVEHLLDILFLLRAQLGHSRHFLNVVTVPLDTGNASGGGMRLLEQTCFSKIGHDVADGRRT